MQDTLFDEVIFTDTPQSLEDKFLQFHADHPEVYVHLERLAREWVSWGHARLGIATLFEKLRWEWHVSGLSDRDGYKLNNNYRAFYARKLMLENPDLDGLFETRVQASERNN